jgi:hypothetical protein
MKPIIDSIVQIHLFDNIYKNILSFKVIAGINNPCVPLSCCSNNTDNFIHQPPCVWAPRGYQADSFLYAMATTYMLTVPLITNGVGGNKSTFHQDHVENFHRKSFRRQRVYINKMLSGEVKPPFFATPSCKSLIDVDMV